MKKLKITQVRSVINRPQPQKLTMKALGLRRIRQQVIKNDAPHIRGMIAKVSHLVEFEEVK